MEDLGIDEDDRFASIHSSDLDEENNKIVDERWLRVQIRCSLKWRTDETTSVVKHQHENVQVKMRRKE